MDSVMYSSWLFIIAVGLTLIYGVMKILNVAHGSMYALGAYVSASLVGYWIGHGHAVAGSYLMLLLAAMLVGVAAGPALFLGNAGLNALHSKPATRWAVWLACGIAYLWLWQISTSNSARVMWLLPLVAILAWPAISKRVFRIIYGSDETVLMLLTYAVFLILEDVVKLIWGVESYYLSDPYNLLGGVQIGEQTYSWYDIARALVAVGIGVAMAAALRYTRSGRLLIAVIHDREISQAMGINVYRFYAVTFTIGAMLAAIGGALTAPTISVVPGIRVLGCTETSRWVRTRSASSRARCSSRGKTPVRISSAPAANQPWICSAS